jgi:aminoglycoside phosphotransferase (APT) family kinase protein
MSELGVGELARVGSFLVDRGEVVSAPLTATLLTGGRSNLTYRLEDVDGRAWALRRPPIAGVIESAHDMVREYRVVEALQQTSVPVARAVGCDASGTVLGAPFGVVEYVDGRTVRSRADVAGWSSADFDACAHAMLDALVALHAVVPTEVGLAAFGRTGGYAARQLSRWTTQWRTMSASDPNADRLGAALAAAIPEQRRTSVVHGDYRVDNTILDSVDPGRVLALVDWELSTLGDPVADVALMCVYRHPALDGILGIEAAWTCVGFPEPEALRTSYEERSGVPLLDWQFHLGLAYFKVAVIAEGIAYRHRLGVTAGEGYAGVAATVPVLLEAGLEAMSKHD